MVYLVRVKAPGKCVGAKHLTSLLEYALAHQKLAHPLSCPAHSDVGEEMVLANNGAIPYFGAVNSEPDYIDRNPYSTNLNPYEVWEYYEIEWGIEFYFVDDVGMGELRLVHSTAIGEVQDYDWMRYLDPSGLSDYYDEY